MAEIRPPDLTVENPDKPTRKDSKVNLESTDTNSSCVYNKKKVFDVWLGIVIFIACGIELVSWYIPQGSDYLLFWYPLMNTTTLIAFSSFFIVKAFRYKSCIYSKIASVGYGLINLISLLAIILPNAKIVTMLMTAYPVIISCVILSLLIVFVRWASGK